MKRKSDEIDLKLTGEKIKKLMEENNRTITDIAEVLDVSPNAIINWQCGVNLIDSVNLIKFAKVLGISANIVYVFKKEGVDNAGDN